MDLSLFVARSQSFMTGKMKNPFAGKALFFRFSVI